MDQKALFRIEYGLYLASTADAGKDNGAILNAVIQVTNTPARVAVTVNNQGYTCELIRKTGKLNLSPLGEKTPFSVFQKFGMQSGRDVNKFEGERPSARKTAYSSCRSMRPRCCRSASHKALISVRTRCLFVT